MNLNENEQRVCLPWPCECVVMTRWRILCHKWRIETADFWPVPIGRRDCVDAVANSTTEWKLVHIPAHGNDKVVHLKIIKNKNMKNSWMKITSQAWNHQFIWLLEKREMATAASFSYFFNMGLLQFFIISHTQDDGNVGTRQTFKNKKVDFSLGKLFSIYCMCIFIILLYSSWL